MIGRLGFQGGRVFLGMLLFAIFVGGASADPPPEPGGYRTDAYRAPTPATLNGGTALSSSEAHALWESKAAVFIDVLPRPPKPKDLPEGTVWRDKPRFNIPGSVWLPDTGYG